MDSVTSINVYGLGISSPEGIQFFKNLTTLQAAKNNISFYNPSGNPNIKGSLVPQRVEEQAQAGIFIT